MKTDEEIKAIKEKFDLYKYNESDVTLFTKEEIKHITETLGEDNINNIRDGFIRLIQCQDVIETKSFTVLNTTNFMYENYEEVIKENDITYRKVLNQIPEMKAFYDMVNEGYNSSKIKKTIVKKNMKMIQGLVEIFYYLNFYKEKQDFIFNKVMTHFMNNGPIYNTFSANPYQTVAGLIGEFYIRGWLEITGADVIAPIDTEHEHDNGIDFQFKLKSGKLVNCDSKARLKREHYMQSDDYYMLNLRDTQVTGHADFVTDYYWATWYNQNDNYLILLNVVPFDMTHTGVLRDKYFELQKNEKYNTYRLLYKPDKVDYIFIDDDVKQEVKEYYVGLLNDFLIKE